MEQIPTIYILDMSVYYERTPEQPARAIKIGTTWHPACRKLAYITSHASPPRYTALFYLKPAAFLNPSELYQLDRRFLTFLETRQLEHLHIKMDGGTEWFWHGSNYVTLISDFLREMHLEF